MDWKIRAYQRSDVREIMQLFWDTVHTVNRADYSEQQLDAWAPKTMAVKQWENSLAVHHSIVVEYNGTIIGFGDIILTGYLDRLYVHKDYQRMGVGTAIADRLEQIAGYRWLLPTLLLLQNRFLKSADIERSENKR